MDLYSRPGTSRTRPMILLIVQLALSAVAVLLFLPLWSGTPAFFLYIAFNLLTTARMSVSMFVYMRRHIPANELVSVMFAFALYYLGIPILALTTGSPDVPGAVIGSVLFVAGSLCNFVSESQRHVWKKDPANAGKLFTGGLFSVSRHPNFFGDFVWVLGYAVVSGSPWAYLVPLLVFLFFYFVNIPAQEKHLALKYGDEFTRYRANVKSFVPFVL